MRVGDREGEEEIERREMGIGVLAALEGGGIEQGVGLGLEGLGGAAGLLVGPSWTAGGRLGLLLSPPYFLITEKKKEKGRKEKVRERVWTWGLFSWTHKNMLVLRK